MAWGQLSISGQFLLAATAVLFVATALLGTWLNEQIKQNVLTTSASQGASLINRFLHTIVQDLGTDPILSAQQQEELDALLAVPQHSNAIVSLKIWIPAANGRATVIYSNNKELVGQSFVAPEVNRAFAGEIVAEYSDVDHEESAPEMALDIALIEVYAPLYSNGSKDVIAVGEIYENAETLAAQLAESQWRTWLIVATTMLLTLAALYLIVRRGGAVIASQRIELNQQVVGVGLLAEQNADLRRVAEKARLDASEANEQLLSRIGADLHDGPIQLLSLLLLKLSAQSQPNATQQELISLTTSALAEMRSIASGLVLPEIHELTLDEVIKLAISRHEDQTGVKASYDGDDLPVEIGEALKICVYRVVQEGLANATKHAPTAAPAISARVTDSALIVTVEDRGPGLGKMEREVGGRPRLGLAGMRNRVGALRGSLQIESAASNGTRIRVSLPIP